MILSELTETGWKIVGSTAFVVVALFLAVASWLKKNKPAKKKPGGGEPPSPKDG